MQFIIPIIISALALKFTQVCGYIFITIHALVFLYCIYLCYLNKPKNDNLLSIFDAAEKEVFLKYHIAIVFPFGAKDFSCTINGFRWIGLFILSPIMFINGFWIIGLLSIALFFLSAEISVRLDPFHFLQAGASNGNFDIEYELHRLNEVNEKYKKYLISLAER